MTSVNRKITSSLRRFLNKKKKQKKFCSYKATKYQFTNIVAYRSALFIYLAAKLANVEANVYRKCRPRF